MHAQHLQANPIAYNSTFFASGKSKLWRIALELHEMHSRGLLAGLINATFSACGKSELWHHAMEPLEMHSQGPRQT